MSEPVTSSLSVYCKSIAQWKEKFKIATLSAELTLKSVLKYTFFQLLAPLQSETLADWHFSFQPCSVFLHSVYTTRNGFAPRIFPVLLVPCLHFIHSSKINTCTAQMTIHSHHSWQPKKSHTHNSVTTAIITYANKKCEVKGTVWWDKFHQNQYSYKFRGIS